MMIKKFLILLFFMVSFLCAQSVEVVDTKQIHIDNFNEVYYPFFGSNNSQIFFSTNNYKGLYSFNRESKNLNVISDLNGAGYNPLLNDENIIYRTHTIIEGRKYQSVTSNELNTGNTIIIEKDIRNLKLPNQIQSSNLLLIKENKVEKKRIPTSKLIKSANLTKAVYVENNNLNYVNGNEAKILNPLGEGVYVWESISNDGFLILFSFGNKGAFICDTEGNVIDNIKDAHYPKFSPDDKYVSYMIDKDDGYNYISSDIYVYSIDLKKSFPITQTNDRIEMYPNWSNDGKHLVYHTNRGELFISTLKFEN